MVDKVPLGIDHVGNGDHGEIEGVRLPRLRVDRRGPRGTLTAPDDIRTDDEIAVRVEGLARTDHVLPPPGVVFPLVETRRMGIA
jgi:hypothetical protein